MMETTDRDRIVTARLAQSVEHETLNLRVVGSSPTLGDCFGSTVMKRIHDHGDN